MDDIVGAWRLDDFSATREGRVSRPLGEKPSGMLLYTADGWMSALLTVGPDARRADDGGASGTYVDTVAYAGRWERAADGAVLHHIRCSHYGPWVDTTLERAVRHEADLLELTAIGPRDAHLSLRWVRAEP